MRYHHILSRMAKIKNKTKITQVLVRMLSNYSYQHIADGNTGPYTILEKSLSVSRKLNIYLP